MLQLIRFVILSMVFLISACGAEHDLSLEGLEVRSGETATQTLKELLASPEKINFSDVQRTVLNVSCTECHSKSGLQEGRVSLSSYDEVFGQGSRNIVVPFNPERSALYNSLIVESGALHMPPKHKAQLSEEQKNVVFQWISSGAKFESAEAVQRPESLKEKLQPFFNEPQKIDYALVNKLIFSKACFKCHSSKSKEAVSDAILYGQDMTSYEKLFSNKGIVKNQLIDKVRPNGEGGVTKVKGSRIYKSVAVHQTMPPAKEGYEPIDSLNVKILKLWILNCAIEDYEAIKDSDELLPPLDEFDDEERAEGKVRGCGEGV